MGVIRETSSPRTVDRISRFRFFAAIAALLLAIGLTAGSASAKAIYVSQNAVGAGSGASCSDAQSASWFNNSANWGSGTSQIAPGTTVHLCGTFTSSLTAQGNGTSSAPIVIVFESGAKISVPYCQGTACLNVRNRSWITIDGGANGIIENTANGTNFSNKVNTPAVDVSGGSNIEVKNLLIRNIYVHTGNTDSAAGFPNGCVIFNNTNNVSIHDLVAHDAHWCLTGGGSNINIYNNDISHVDHAVTFGNQTSGTTYSNINIYNNHFHDFANWDVGDINNHPYHHDAIQLWGLDSSGNASSSNGQVTNLKIYNNLMDGDSGDWVTGWIYLMDSVNNAYVFNNVIVATAGRNIYGLIRIDATTGDNAQGPISVLNNTIIGNNSGGYCVWGTFQNSFSVANNVITGCETLIKIDNSTIAANGLNNNIYKGVGGSQTFSLGSNSTGSISTWQGLTHQDAASKLVTSISLDGNGVPQTGSPVIGAGANLSSTGVAALKSDKSGTLRASTGAWDAGAYVFGSVSRPEPPTDLTAVVDKQQ